MGVLLCADNTPIYYAQSLVEQLLKSAKKRAKDLKIHGYLGGTVDFLVMKSVAMISSNIKEFRNQALTKPKLKLYAAPYTLHEIGGLIDTVQALKDSGFPRSQLYQLRSFLEQGRRTAMLNYRYFRTRLGDKGEILKTAFEKAWCAAKTNDGNLAPWISILGTTQDEEEANTTWRDLVDLIPFTQESKTETQKKTTSVTYKPLSSSETRSPRRY
jgi:CRISPR-associated protein Cmr2